MKYRNWKCNAYHIYGDNSNKEWSYQELKEYFNIDGNDWAKCIKDFVGNTDNHEYYSFKCGDMITIMESSNGFRLRKVY